MMRQIVLSTVALGMLASCGDPDAGALFADIQYVTRCEETGGCPGARARDICGIHLGDPCLATDPEPQLSCTILEAADGSTRTLSFSATRESGIGISVSQAVIASTGGAASGAACRVTVDDGANTYVGACGSATPSPAQPCRLDGVTFANDLEGNPTVQGNLFCQFLENDAQASLRIEVTALPIASGPGFSSDTPPTSNCGAGSAIPACSPARFSLVNCSGLEIED